MTDSSWLSLTYICLIYVFIFARLFLFEIFSEIFPLNAVRPHDRWWLLMIILFERCYFPLTSLRCSIERFIIGMLLFFCLCVSYSLLVFPGLSDARRVHPYVHPPCSLGTVKEIFPMWRGGGGGGGLWSPARPMCRRWVVMATRRSLVAFAKLHLHEFTMAPSLGSTELRPIRCV